MDRRRFLASSLAVSAVATAARATAQVAPHSSVQVTPQAPLQSSIIAGREFYLLRRYHMVSGPQLKSTESYFSGALLPALGRMGLGPVGALKLDYGPETPAYYVLIPGLSADVLAELDLRLGLDQEFLAAADGFWNAKAAAPAFERVESWLLVSFAGWPKATPPAAAAGKGKRILQMRTYESPSNGEHVRKVQMFHSGEFEIFTDSGFHPVFFGDTLVGSNTPSLTYMLSFTDLNDMDMKWNVFRNAPAWKKLSADPRFAFDPIVSNISNLVLSPLDCSQI